MNQPFNAGKCGKSSHGLAIRRHIAAGAFNIRDLTTEDVQDLAVLHQSTFAGALGASLGRTYLLAFFRWFILNPESIKLVCTKGPDAVGYVFGAPDGYGPSMNRSIFWPIVIGVLSQPWVVAHPSFGRQIPIRLRILLQRWVRRQRRSPSNASKHPTGNRPMYVLVGIGVGPSARGRGLANRLMDVFENRVWEQGFEAIRLSVFTSNSPAFRLYERRGWKQSSPDGQRKVLSYVLPMPRLRPEEESSRVHTTRG